MKNSIFFALLFLMPLAVSAQHINDGDPMDSTVIRFSDTGSIPGFLPDTAALPLWQIGRTHKSFFTTDTTAVTVMTDTLHPYRINADNWFVVKINNRFNTIVDFWHKYQTDATHAGGIVEFSTDYGLTWQNIKGACNIDSGSVSSGILTQNFYTFNDTLLTGEPAFTGTSGGTQQYSRFQFFDGYPVRTTNGSGCDLESFDTFYVRFRFISDSTTDTLAGWEIDSIKIELDYYGSYVTEINRQNTLKVFPNPSYDGAFTFPALANEEQYHIEIYNEMGMRILKTPYNHSVDLSAYAKGLYFYKVSGGVAYYSGRLQIE